MAGAQRRRRLSLDSLDRMQTFFKAEGIIDKTAPRERLVDASFAETATKELGPFEVINKAIKRSGCALAAAH
jgi:hypothetical protein